MRNWKVLLSKMERVDGRKYTIHKLKLVYGGEQNGS